MEVAIYISDVVFCFSRGSGLYFPGGGLDVREEP